MILQQGVYIAGHSVSYWKIQTRMGRIWTFLEGA